MYTIGEFSKIGSVSTKTLRYYDAIGLLKPAHVDCDNRYRYYSEAQVYDILFIAELKSYDLRLEQIKAILEAEDKTLLKHFLEERIDALDAQMRQSIWLKGRIEEKLEYLQTGGMMMERQVNLVVEEKDFEPVLVMGRHGRIAMSQCSDFICTVLADVEKAGLTCDGPVMLFYEDEEVNPEQANIEVCVTVADSEAARKNPAVRTLAPGTCAVCDYSGPYERLGEVYAALIKWIDTNHRTITSAPFDCYMNNPLEVASPEDYRTVVYFPIQ